MNTPSGLHMNSIQLSEESDNLRFINHWLSGVLHEFARDSEVFNVWLKNPKNFLALINYLRCEGTYNSCEIATLEGILHELKKNGYHVYTCKLNKLITGSQ